MLSEGGVRVKEIQLGRKIHKPSFNKIIPMFQQVAATALYTLAKHKDNYRCFNLNKVRKEILEKNQKWVDEFINKPKKENIFYLREYAFSKFNKLSKQSIKKYLGIHINDFKKIFNEKQIIQTDQWVKIMASLVRYINKNPISQMVSKKIATTISPFFFLRVISYFDELEKSSYKKIAENIIQNQTQKLLNSVRKNS